MSTSARNIIAWILQVFLALVFIKSGFDKLNQGYETVTMFVSMDLPGWFTYLIGGAELLGGIGLLMPRMVRPAALGLINIMVGALVMHAIKIPGGSTNSIPAIMMLLLLSVLLLLPRRPAAQVA